nr:RNA-directed DNA polymerase, eukaryota [Tanacetum cinerariifolium]
MRSYRSKEDEVLKISTSVFVANFSDSFCEILANNMGRLVNNLCTVWVGRHKLQANIPRFQREPLKRHSSFHNIDGVKRDNSRDMYTSNGVKGAANSYAHVVKGSQNSKMDSDSSLVMVLDDSCLNEKDYSHCLMGKVKDFATLANLKVVVANEGFDNIKFKYMGGYWIQLASSDFNTDGTITWVEIEGIPLKMWSKNKFNRVASKWDVLLDVDDQEDEHFHRKRICINTNVPTNIFESFKLIYRGKVFWVRAKEVPGWILDFMEDNDEYEDSKVGSYEEVPNGEDVKNVKDLEGDSDGEIVPDTNASVGNSGGILCVWDPNMFKKMNSTVSGELVIMGDFNEVRNKSERFGTLFNRQGADVFNRFISNTGLEEVPLEGRTEVVNLLQEVEKKNSLEAAQKAKIKWAIEGDENFKYYHGVINKKRNQLSIHGILVEGTWIDSPSLVKISKEEIKKEVWDCGIDESPGPDGFTFGFIFGGNSSFIILIPKTPNANMVKDYRPISLIGSMYKIISKILANLLVVVLGGLVNEIQSAFVADKQILDGPFILNELVQWCKKKKKQSLVFKVDSEKVYDSVRWDHLDDIMRKFGFGEKWCMWIQIFLRSSRGSVIVNGSPTEEFWFYKGLKQGDPLSPFLFIMVMESLHISFQRVVDVGSMPIYHMSLFKVPKKVLHRMESMRSHFFNGAELSSKKVIKALCGYDGKIGQKVKSCYPSLWLDIIHEVEILSWCRFGLDVLFHRPPRGGVELQQFEHMKEKVEGCILADMMDRWFWALEGSGEFTITSVRKMIDASCYRRCHLKRVGLKRFLLRYKE